MDGGSAHIAAADAGPARSDEDIVGCFELGNWTVFEGDFVWGMQNERRVLRRVRVLRLGIASDELERGMRAWWGREG